MHGYFYKWGVLLWGNHPQLGRSIASGLVPKCVLIPLCLWLFLQIWRPFSACPCEKSPTVFESILRPLILGNSPLCGFLINPRCGLTARWDPSESQARTPKPKEDDGGAPTVLLERGSSAYVSLRFREVFERLLRMLLKGRGSKGEGYLRQIGEPRGTLGTDWGVLGRLKLPTPVGHPCLRIP